MNPLNEPGVYAIRCRSTQELYIGSSNWIGYRATTHLEELRRGVHCNPRLASLAKRNGVADLDFAIVEVCELGSERDREVHWFSVYRPQINSMSLSDETATGKAELKFRPLVDVVAEYPIAQINLILPPDERDTFEQWCRYGGKPRLSMTAAIRELMRQAAAGKIPIDRERAKRLVRAAAPPAKRGNK